MDNISEHKHSRSNFKNALNYKGNIFKMFFTAFIFLIGQEYSMSWNSVILQSDSLENGVRNTTIDSILNTDFKTFKILTNINDEQKVIADQLYNLQYELGIPKGMELTVLEIYVDKTSEDVSKWNVLINDTTLQLLPSLGWNYLTDESRDLLDNWRGRGEKTNLEFKKVYTVNAKPNEMFRVKAVPLVEMGQDSRLSNLQKVYAYEVLIVDDYPEQIEIQPKQGLIIKRIDAGTFRIKLSRFNRAEFEKWSEGRADDPYIYTTSIILYDKISNVKSIPINLKFTFGEY